MSDEDDEEDEDGPQKIKKKKGWEAWFHKLQECYFMNHLIVTLSSSIEFSV